MGHTKLLFFIRSFDRGEERALIVVEVKDRTRGAGPLTARDFGSIDRWRAEFVAIGKAEGGGSGWVLLTWSPRDKRLVNTWAADHATTLAGG
jgi:superoxide dismutase